MKPLFVDTSALIALGNEGDVFHKKAEKIRRELIMSQRIFLTTSLVIVEFYNSFSKIRFRSIATAMLESIRKSDKWIYVDINIELMKEGFEYFRQMKDKEWSLTDCISILVAKD